MSLNKNKNEFQEFKKYRLYNQLAKSYELDVGLEFYTFIPICNKNFN